MASSAEINRRFVSPAVRRVALNAGGMPRILNAVRLVYVMAAQATGGFDLIVGIVGSMTRLAGNRHSRAVVEKLAVYCSLDFFGMAGLAVAFLGDQLEAGFLNTKDMAGKTVVLRKRFASEFIFRMTGETNRRFRNRCVIGFIMAVGTAQAGSGNMSFVPGRGRYCAPFLLAYRGRTLALEADDSACGLSFFPISASSG
jgi:hypothetical protein